MMQKLIIQTVTFVAMMGCGAEAVKLEAEAGTEGFLKGLA